MKTKDRAADDELWDATHEAVREERRWSALRYHLIHLLENFIHRVRTGVKIGRSKRNLGRPIRDLIREAEVLQTWGEIFTDREHITPNSARKIQQVVIDVTSGAQERDQAGLPPVDAKLVNREEEEAKIKEFRKVIDRVNKVIAGPTDADPGILEPIFRILYRLDPPVERVHELVKQIVSEQIANEPSSSGEKMSDLLTKEEATQLLWVVISAWDEERRS